MILSACRVCESRRTRALRVRERSPHAARRTARARRDGREKEFFRSLGALDTRSTTSARAHAHFQQHKECEIKKGKRRQTLAVFAVAVACVFFCSSVLLLFKTFGALLAFCAAVRSTHTRFVRRGTLSCLSSSLSSSSPIVFRAVKNVATCIRRRFLLGLLNFRHCLHLWFAL